MTPKEFLTKVETMNLPEDLKQQIKTKLSGENVTNQDLSEVQELIASSLDQDFKDEGIEVDVENNPELKAAYNTMNKEMDESEDEYVKNVATVKVVSDYLESAAQKVSKTAENIKQEDLKKEIDEL